LVDINYLHQDPININNICNGFKIHGGFLSFYQNFRDKMFEIINKYYNNETKLFISGFSLGGAISTLAALDLYKYNNINNMIHYSFASPRLFNIIGANHFDSLNISSNRIYNDNDIVPSLPFPIMISSIKSLTIQDFMHIGKSISFNNNIGNYYDNHILSYLKYFKLI
jgi:triacylglycerol lipase